MVRLRDLAIVLGHVISSIQNLWLLNGCGNLAGTPLVAKRDGDISWRLLVTSSLSLPVCGIEPISQTSQNVGLGVFGGRVGLSLVDDGFGGNLLTEKISSLRPQVIAVLANLSHAFRIQPFGVAAWRLSLSQACDHGLNTNGRVSNLRGRLQALSKRLQRGVTTMLANALQHSQPIR